MVCQARRGTHSRAPSFEPLALDSCVAPASRSCRTLPRTVPETVGIPYGRGAFRLARSNRQASPECRIQVSLPTMDAQHLADVSAIKRLRERDATASQSGDFATLRAIMSHDAVVLPPGGKPQIGKAAIDAAFERAATSPRTYEVLEYRFDLSEPEIVGNIAVEYGLIRGSSRDLKSGEVTAAEYNVMRVLRKETDGQWRVYRTIWTPGG